MDPASVSKLARAAVGCSHCFMPARKAEWGFVPVRPADRPDDVAAAPWVGPEYATSNPRTAVVMLNPGYKAADHKLIRRDLGHQFRDGRITFRTYSQRIAPLVPYWGFGAVIRWLKAMGLAPDKIAFLNLALCAVADDAYFPELFETCFFRHTRNIITALAPTVVLLCGKRHLAPFVELIRALGSSVILTWHYRPMNTESGQRELTRVRAELKKQAS